MLERFHVAKKIYITLSHISLITVRFTRLSEKSCQRKKGFLLISNNHPPLPPRPVLSRRHPIYVYLLHNQPQMALTSLILLFLSYLAVGQTCDNYGLSNSSGCICPVGFGGSNCSQPGCGGDIFQGTQRPLTPLDASGNLTAGGCTCESGWGGVGCNVCQNNDACESAFLRAEGGTDPDVVITGKSDNVTCNTALRVYAAGLASCDVVVRFPFPIRNLCVSLR